MNARFHFERLVWTIVTFMILASVTGCGTGTPVTTAVPGITVAATQVQVPTPTAGPSSITVVIPEDPPSFNALVSDTGYDALVMKMVLLGMTAVDADRRPSHPAAFVTRFGYSADRDRVGGISHIQLFPASQIGDRKVR